MQRHISCSIIVSHIQQIWQVTRIQYQYGGTGMQRRILQLLFLALFIAMLLPAHASADSADYDVPGGHFYSQARGNADPSKGYVISDADGVPFWTWFQRLGGVAKLGYPASHRFLWNGFWVQVCQKVILQWRP